MHNKFSGAAEVDPRHIALEVIKSNFEVRELVHSHGFSFISTMLSTMQ
jgi:hypothetical protein